MLYSELSKVSLPSISVVPSSRAYEAGGHELLVQQLCGSCPRTLANSAATLGNMAGEEVIRCSILSHGAIRALVEHLKSTNTQVLVNTMQCLAVLACDAEARAEVGVRVSNDCSKCCFVLMFANNKNVMEFGEVFCSF